MKSLIRPLLFSGLLWAGVQAHAQETKRPNILVIWGDDIGMWDLSAYHRGMMGSQTPNIDRTELKQELLDGKEIGGETYRVHLDGYDQSDLLLDQGKTRRKDFYYFTENTFNGLRYGDWKILFRDQDKWFRAVNAELTSPYIINLKMDPFERFTEARGYDEWAENRSWLFGPAGQQVGIFIKSFEDYPPRQPSFSPNVGDIAEILNRTSKARR